MDSRLHKWINGYYIVALIIIGLSDDVYLAIMGVLGITGGLFTFGYVSCLVWHTVTQLLEKESQ